MKQLVFIFMLLGPVGLKAQSFEATLKKSYEIFYEDCFDIQVETKLYTTSLRGTPLKTDQVHYQKCNKDLFISSREMEQLITEDLVLYLDKSGGLLVIGKQMDQNGGAPAMSLNSMIEFASAMVKEAANAPEQISLPSGQKGFVFKSPSFKYESAAYWFSADGMHLEKMSFVLASKEPKTPNTPTVVDYVFTYNNKPVNPELFSINRYGKLQGKKFTPSAAYRNFELLNQL